MKAVVTVVKRAVAVMVFLCLLSTLLLWAGGLCTLNSENSEKRCWDLYYTMKNETLDMVFVGSSTVYSFYCHAQAYDEQKIHSLALFSSAKPAETIPYLLNEIVKYNNTELIAVELRNLLKDDCKEEIENMEERYHYRALSLSMMKPLSMNRIRGVFDLLSDNKSVPTIEYLFPILQYHEDIYTYPLSFVYANKRDFENFYGFCDITEATDFSEEEQKLQNETPSGKYHLSEKSKKLIDEMVKIVDSHGIKLLFVLTPYIYSTDEYVVACEIRDYLAEKNCDFLNCNDYTEEIGMDSSSDYYDLSHVNAVGTHKFTSWFAKYLREHYDFYDDYTEEINEKWDRLAAGWREVYSRLADEIGEEIASNA